MPLKSKYIIDREESLDYDKVVAQLLKCSYPDLEGDRLAEFLNPSLKNIPNPLKLKGINEASELFLDAYRQNKKILIVGVYDVDGITSSSLWVRFFHYLGLTNYSVFIPNRFKHGYGLSRHSIADIMKHEPELIITVDNGVTAADIVQELKEKGVQVLITDHHMPNEQLPDCPIINPKLPDCQYPDKEITGAGVAFLFIVELRRRLREEGVWNDERPEPNLIYDLDLVAMGTIADQAPLMGLNRIFTYFGLRQIEQNNRKDAHRGFYSYINALFKHYPPLRHYNTDNELVAFKISPLLNASGRMENAIIGVQFLTATNIAIAENMLKRLDRLNKKRYQIQSEMMEIATVQANNQARLGGMCIFDPSFHEGLAGLIAGKLSIEFKLPVIVLAEAQFEPVYKGSCRIPAGGSMLNILKHCEEFIESYGGHENAAGLVIKKEHLENFKKAYFNAVKFCDYEMPKRDEHNADVQIPSELINSNFYDRIKTLEPHGVGNPRPVFSVKKINLGKQTIMNKNLIKWDLGNNVEAIYWDHDPEKKFYSGMLDLTFEMKMNAFKGNGLQLIIKKIYND